MQGRMLLPSAARRVEDRAGAPLERRAPDRAGKILQALGPAAHDRTPYGRRVLVEGRAAQRRACQDDGLIAHPRVEDCAPLAPPVVDLHFSAPPA